MPVQPLQSIHPSPVLEQQDALSQFRMETVN